MLLEDDLGDKAKRGSREIWRKALRSIRSLIILSHGFCAAALSLPLHLVIHVLFQPITFYHAHFQPPFFLL
jgi:hypothetical protein